MSNLVVQSVNDTNGRSKQTMQSYQSNWMAHWTRTSCNAAEETHDQDGAGNEELDYDTRDDHLTNGSRVSRSGKGLGLIETKTFAIVDESLKMSSEGMGNGRMHSCLFKYGQDTDEMQTLRPVFGDNLEQGKAVDCKSGIQCTSLIPGIPATNRISSQGYHSLGEGTSKNPPKWMKTDSAGIYSSFAVPNPLQEFVESSCHIVPHRFDLEKYEFDKGKAVVSPLISRSSVASKQLPNDNLRMLEREHWHEYNHSADFVCDRKMDSQSQSDISMNACFGEGNTCDGRDWFPKMQKCSGIRLFPSQCINASEKTETKKSDNDCHSLQKLQNCVHDVETTHSLLITKKTCVNLLEENDTFRSTRVISEVKGNTTIDLDHLRPFFGQGRQGVKLQPLSSSVDGEAKENTKHVKASKITIKDESSTETDTMDMDSFTEKNLHSGAYSTSSTEAFNMDSKLPLWIDGTSSREVGCRRLNIGLPDINLELSALPGSASSSENTCPSSSKTQHFDMDELLAHVEQPKPKANFSLDDCPNADPGNRWVKRLKLSSSNSFAQTTKRSNLTDNLSHEKMSKLSSRILKSSIASSEPTPRKHHGKESVLSDKNEDFLKKDENLMVDPRNKGIGLLLSNAWIQRWLRNGSRITEKKPETEVLFKPESSRFALDNLQKEQFPSVAAIGTDGKGYDCF